MNYRHAYHAGNFADVLKHVILVRIIEYLKKKPAPFRVIDTHAGAGSYDLAGVAATKTGEWRDGVARIRDAVAPAGVAELVQPYLDIVAGSRAASANSPTYPGSPLIAHTLLRAGDKLIANELHAEEAATLRAALRGARNAKVMTLDGYQAVKSLLPPPERRGVILIDPPFEDPDEFARLATAVEDGLRRFATGTFVVWYPVKDRGAADGLTSRVFANPGVEALDARLAVSSSFPGLGLTETGVLVVNPPFCLREELAIILPWLRAALATGRGGEWRLQLSGVQTRPAK